MGIWGVLPDLVKEAAGAVASASRGLTRAAVAGQGFRGALRVGAKDAGASALG